MSDGSGRGSGRHGGLREKVERLLRLDSPLVEPRESSRSLPATISIAIVIGVLAGLASTLIPHPITLGGVGVGDIGPPAVSAKLYLDGRSPYQLRLRIVETTLYPFTTSLALSPLLLLPPQWWAPLFTAVISALLAFAVLIRGEAWRLLMLFSLPFWSAVHSVQWSPLFAAALLLPALLPVAVVKPQLGVVLALAGRWRLRDVLSAAGFTLLSLVLLPSWPLMWLREGRLDRYEGSAPMLVGAGILLASCLLLWRSGRGRLLLAMSIVSQRYYFDQFLLFLIPRNVAQMIVLLATSWAGAATCFATGWWVPAAGTQDARVWHVTVATIFLPCLAMVWWERWKPDAGVRGTFSWGSMGAWKNRVGRVEERE